MLLPENMYLVGRIRIFRKGNFFFSDAWEPVFHTEQDQLYIIFGLDPAIYVYENQVPFSLITSFPIELPDYHCFKGAEKYNSDDVRFYGQRRTSGKILNIKKIGEYYLLAYFPGYNVQDTEESFSNNRSPDFWDRMWEKYPTRIAVLDTQGTVINNFVPDGLLAASMLVRNGELWMMGKADGEVELDYFRLFRVGLDVR